MLTIKNQTGLWFGFLAVLILLLVGCTPPGPRALLKGRELLEKGRYTEAVEQFETATSLLSSNAQAWNYLGLAYHHSRRSADAEKAYQHALRLDNDLTEARYNLGCLWLEENKLDWAKSELTAFTLRRGDNPQGFLKLATAQLRSQELTAAEKTFSEVLRIDPQDAEALTGIGLVRLQRGRAPEAAGYFVAALKHHPRYRPALINLAVVAHQHLRNKPLALQKYREYLALGPSNDSDQVKAAVRQLESETAPSAARPQPSPVPTQPTNPTIAKAPPQEIQRPAPVQKSQPAPEPPKTAALPTTHPAPTPQETVSANKPKPSPPQTEKTLTETVRLAPEPVIKAAEDADHSDASVHSPGNSQVTAPTETATQPAKVPRKSVFQRLFGRDNPARESNASQPVAEMPSQTVTGAIARYKYAAPF
ncbi:MAG TPA: tetratricopeptide repeat protein, partial [Clostridia bacterium]|nr:tetratricopeptide repeat protein [Clostridia bacterium]